MVVVAALWRSAAAAEKVLKKLGYQLSAEDIDALVNAHQGVIEQVLWTVQAKVR